MAKTAYYSVLMTRNVTESAHFPVEIEVDAGADEEAVLHLVREAAHDKSGELPETAWTLDDGNDSDAYFGDPDNPGDPIGKAKFKAQEAGLEALRLAERHDEKHGAKLAKIANALTASFVQTLGSQVAIPEGADLGGLQKRLAEALKGGLVGILA